VLSHKKINIINGIMNGQMNSSNGTQSIPVHPDFRIFLTQNPSSGQFGSTRTKFSATFFSHFSRFYFNKLSDKDLLQLVY
jgi:midasin (ATPase involved in ribosome maturation)